MLGCDSQAKRPKLLLARAIYSLRFWVSIMRSKPIIRRSRHYRDMQRRYICDYSVPPVCVPSEADQGKGGRSRRRSNGRRCFIAHAIQSSGGSPRGCLRHTRNHFASTTHCSHCPPPAATDRLLALMIICTSRTRAAVGHCLGRRGRENPRAERRAGLEPSACRTVLFPSPI